MVIIHGRRGADHAIAGEAVARQARVITSTLANDVRAARAPGRDDVDDPVQLGELIQAGDPGVADIVAAGPDELRIVTRARAATSSSCVWWKRDEAGAVTRAIYADLRCAGTPTRTERLGTVPRQSSPTLPGTPDLFSYGVLVDLDAASGDPDRCRVDEVASPPIPGRIVQVGARLDLNASPGRETRREATVDMTGIRSRDEPDYRAALGCGW
jgi:hypothetical protein